MLLEDLSKKINKLDEVISNKFSEKEFKYLLIIIFIIPLALIYNNFFSSIKNIQKIDKEIVSAKSNLEELKAEVSTLQILTSATIQKIAVIKESIKELNNLEKELVKVKEKLRFFKLDDTAWVEILNEITNYINNNGYKLKNIEVYINKKGKVKKQKIGKDNKKLSKETQDNVENLIKLINYQFSSKLKLLKPKFYFYIKLKGKNFKNLLNIIKQIEKSKKIKYVYLIKNTNISKNSQEYSLLIIYMTTNKG